VTTPTDRIAAAEAVLREWNAPLEAIDNYALAVFEKNATETSDVMRRIGKLLMEHKCADVWALAYREYLSVIWPDHDYHDGDETRFLHASELFPE